METLIGLILINLIVMFIAVMAQMYRLDKIDQTLKSLRKHIEVTDANGILEPMSNSAIAEKKWQKKNKKIRTIY